MPKLPSSESPTRGRPALSEQHIEDMRRRIADAALKLFETEGYEAVSMRKLANEAGCTVMTLYRYFDRKIDILRHLWASIFSDLFDQLASIADGKRNGTARLHAVCAAYVHYWLDQREHYFLVFMSSGVSQPDVSIFVENDETVGRFALIQELVSGALPAGTASDEIALKTQLLMCSLNGIAHNLITISGYPWAEPDALVKAAVTGALAS